MTPFEYATLLEYIKKNNSWNKLYEVTYERHRRAIKYADCIFDSRDGRVWLITFRTVVSGKDNADTTFRVESQEDIKNIYKWLDEIEDWSVNDERN